MINKPSRSLFDGWWTVLLRNKSLKSLKPKERYETNLLIESVLFDRVVEALPIRTKWNGRELNKLRASLSGAPRGSSWDIAGISGNANGPFCTNLWNCSKICERIECFELEARSSTSAVRPCSCRKVRSWSRSSPILTESGPWRPWGSWGG